MEVYEASLGTRFDEVVEAGKVHRFENLEELAETFGLPAGTLEATVELTNRSARGLAPDPWPRCILRRSAGAALLRRPRAGRDHTQGGLKVDSLARVLEPDGHHIPGLYAGGGTAVGVSGSGYEATPAEMDFWRRPYWARSPARRPRARSLLAGGFNYSVSSRLIGERTGQGPAASSS